MLVLNPQSGNSSGTLLEVPFKALLQVAKPAAHLKGAILQVKNKKSQQTLHIQKKIFTFAAENTKYHETNLLYPIGIRVHCCVLCCHRAKSICI
jgi:hypothetical protein